MALKSRPDIGDKINMQIIAPLENAKKLLDFTDTMDEKT